MAETAPLISPAKDTPFDSIEYMDEDDDDDDDELGSLPHMTPPPGKLLLRIVVSLSA